MHPSKFLIFVASELLSAKTEEFKTNKILNYIYNKKPLHILEMYGLKKCKLIPYIIVNHIIVIAFNCTCAYAWDYTLVIYNT